MDDEINLSATVDRRLQDDVSSGPPGVEESYDLGDSQSFKKEDSRSRRRDSRSKSPVRRRRRSRSKSHSFSDDRRRRSRYEERDPRLRNRRSRSRDRARSRGRNRSPSHRSRRSRSNSRSRRSGGWSPKKKGPVSPPPPTPTSTQPPVMNQPPFNMVTQAPPQQPPTMYGSDGYGNYAGAYGPNMAGGQRGYPRYDYPVGVPPNVPFGTYQPPTGPPMQPVPPGDEFQQTPQWNQVPPAQMVPPPSMAMVGVNSSENQSQLPQMQITQQTAEDKQKRDAAVAQEKKNQQATLRKQREDYKRRSNALKRELNILKEQREDLVSGSEPPSPTTKGFLKENDRLQLQIENKIKTIENVIDLLSGIIGNDADESPSPPPPVPSSTASSVNRKSKKKSITKSDDDSSPERLKNKAMESMQKKKSSRSAKDGKEINKIDDEIPEKPKSMDIKNTDAASHINFVHYDPEMHWCRPCGTFPKTAKDYLMHLHTKEHMAQPKSVESPWHEKPFKDELPVYLDAPTKRTPIRGLQFFVPSTGWYCKLCAIWMGDLHCASFHLKSKTHADKYTTFAAQNPDFEVDWMADRQKAYETSRELQQEQHNLAPPPPPFIMTTPKPVPPPTITKPSIVEDGIPLQLQPLQSNLQQQHHQQRHLSDSDDNKRSKKKKKKHDEKREKKKKKRSKKRKHSTTSSSSSESSDSDDSDDGDNNDGGDNDKNETSQSIRVAMRNLLKKQQKEKKQSDDEENSGKWTVVQPSGPPPPPPTISENGANNVKKDEMLIAQWNAREPIITEKEKKLLEQLKGRLKNRSNDSDTNGLSGKNVFKDSDRDREDNVTASGSVSGGGQDESNDHDKSRDREKNRDYRRGRSRSRSRDRDRDRKTRRRSRSRGRRSSRSRSRSTHRWNRRRSRSRSRSRVRRIEKPIVRYPEFRPRVPENDRKNSKDKDRDRDRKKGSVKSDAFVEDTEKKTVILLKKSTPNTKKLPFIGRMPVFKKQTTDEEVLPKKEEMIRSEKTLYTPYTTAASATILVTHHSSYDALPPMAPMDDYDDLMPDPMQFVSLMGAPPPPPMVPPPDMIENKNEPVLPPGIDENEVDLVPQPISDAPLPRKGPLPQDFQDALSIIFPGEKKQISENSEMDASIIIDHNEQSLDEVKHQCMDDPLQSKMIATAPLIDPIPTTITPTAITSLDDHSQHSMDMYGRYAVGIAAVVTTAIQSATDTHVATTVVSAMDDINFAEDVDIPSINVPPLPPPPPPPPLPLQMKNELVIPDSIKIDNSLDNENKSRLDKLNDLALLGIDTDDLAAQCM